MCYVGKATKIFIFLVTVMVVMSIGLLLGYFNLLRGHSSAYGGSHKCSHDLCPQATPIVFPTPTPNLSPMPPPTLSSPPPPQQLTSSLPPSPPPTLSPPTPVMVTPGPVNNS
ncbi:hypothetical protein BUALT_Bualt03G0205700 [Buddleja alternifolia]|uniref:Uncharacterized protein n=1 Tax=Buddleja alternifolia TaxID=168488 RepID=A0AAV6Y404_9LAMI|nr:hypothetical protein BUALT_Bualt03G0205700 [Buddleja alternifolia]